MGVSTKRKREMVKKTIIQHISEFSTSIITEIIGDDMIMAKYAGKTNHFTIESSGRNITITHAETGFVKSGQQNELNCAYLIFQVATR